MIQCRSTWRARLKPIAARVGIHSSRLLWRGLALRAYRRKLRDHQGFRRWYETEAPRWMAHWGHEAGDDEFDRAHLASQLYELTEMLCRRIGPIGGARVLDAGASDGLFLARLGVTHGVGINLLPICAKKIRTDGYAACIGDIEVLPFFDKSFDYVICCETLEHVPNPIRVLNELARVCRERIHLTIPWVPRTRITGRPNGWPQVESHIFEFSEMEFAKVLTHARVRMRSQDRVQVFPEPWNPVARWWLGVWMYPSFFPKLQYYELEPS